MKKIRSAKLFLYTMILVILALAVFAAVDLYKKFYNITENETVGFCNLPEDCESQNILHPLCVGYWVCGGNRCGWVCGVENVTAPTGGLSGSTVECYDDSHCPAGNCPDGTTYKRFSCSANKCYEIQYFADPCTYR